MAEKKVNKGGRPKGSKDSKPRKRRPSKGPNPWAKKTKGKKTQTNRNLLLNHLRSYNFDVVQEILWLYDQLKGQVELITHTDENGEKMEMKIYPKEVSAQMLDILKVLVSHSFPKMKALELRTGHDNPISLTFDLGGGKTKKVEATVEEEEEQAIDMMSGPGGLHLPVPTKET